MNLTDDEVLKFQKGSPIFLEDICVIYPATIGEIVDEGYSKFQQYLSILTAGKPILDKNEDPELKQLLSQLTDFQYILMMLTTDLESNEVFKNACRFFFHENRVSFSLDPAQIIFGSLEEKHILNERNFSELQKILRHMYFIDHDNDDIVIYEDDDPAVRKLKMQLIERKEKLRRAKAKKAGKEDINLNFSDLIGSITINHCGLNIDNIWNITYYAFHDQLTRMGWRDQFNINNQAAMAGAKLQKSQLKHWMRSIADSNKS